MKILQFIIFCLVLSVSCFGQNKDEVVFYKKGSKRKISTKLPTELTILKNNGEILHRSKVYAKSDSSLFILSHLVDTDKVNALLKNESYSKKEKKAKLLELYTSDTITVEVRLNDIQKVTIHTTSTNQIRYKLRFWGLSLMYLVSSGFTLYTIVNNIGDSYSALDVSYVLSAPILYTLWIRTAHLRLKTEKWDIR